jgi:ribosomal protein S18 acetylase RimI-like enzyme
VRFRRPRRQQTARSDSALLTLDRSDDIPNAGAGHGDVARFCGTAYARGVTIRRATLADEAAMQALWDEFDAETTYTPYAGSPFAATMLTDHVALVAEDSAEPVGCVYANTGSDHYGFVFGLYVRPLSRRRGIARDLMRAVAEALRVDGKQYVVLNVDTPNEVARSLYSELGFVDAARTLRVEIDQLLG